MGPRDLAPGLAFAPPEHELTDVYLRRKIAGQPIPVSAERFIHDADVYSAEPENLVEERACAPGSGEGEKQQPVWYFFSPVRYAGKNGRAGGGGGRRSRTIAGDSSKRWHPECAPKPVKGGSAVGGYEHKLSYMVKQAASRSGKDERAGWIMAEYGISSEHGGGDLVLCKIYRSHRTGSRATSTTSSSSSSTAAAAVSDTSGSKKRKAAGDHHPEAPTPGARPRQTDEDVFAESLEHALIEWSDETAAELYGTAYLPGSELELPPCAQESFLPSSELYGSTAHIPSGGETELAPWVEDLFKLDQLPPLAQGFEPSEEAIQQMILELSS